MEMEKVKSMLDVSVNEMWKILDAIKHYHDDYYVNDNVTKMLKDIEKKIKKTIKQEQTK